jgi:hypothetical protein
MQFHSHKELISSLKMIFSDFDHASSGAPQHSYMENLSKTYCNHNLSWYRELCLNERFFWTTSQDLSIIVHHLRWQSSRPHWFVSLSSEENLCFLKWCSLSQLSSPILKLGLIASCSLHPAFLSFSAARQRFSLPLHIVALSHWSVSICLSCFMFRSPSIFKIFTLCHFFYFHWNRRRSLRRTLRARPSRGRVEARRFLR